MMFLRASLLTMLGLLGFMGVQLDAAASAATGSGMVTDMVETSVSEHQVRNLARPKECNCNRPCRCKNRRRLKKELEKIAEDYISNVVTTVINDCNGEVLFEIPDNYQKSQNTVLSLFFRMVWVSTKHIGLTW